ncbi:MAG: hypothetical protein HY943_05250, partial [Gammaproteobacteria bacterium]|nr:hypothetical protein [Gammaproteobacteria bacterium]
MTMRSDELLPDDLETLRSVVAHERAVHRTALQTRDAEIERLREQVRLLLAQRFGRKSEKLATEEAPQLPLFNEAEAEAADPSEEAAEAAEETP